MASALRRPRLHALLYPPKCLRKPRNFSHAPVSLAAGAKSAIAQARQLPQKSLKVANREAFKVDVLPHDIGLLPGGAGYGIHPCLPTWLSNDRYLHNAEWRQEAFFLETASRARVFGMVQTEETGSGLCRVGVSVTSCLGLYSLLTRYTPSVVYYKWGITKKPRPRPKLALGSTGRIAQALHTRMYTAFAEYVCQLIVLVDGVDIC